MAVVEACPWPIPSLRRLAAVDFELALLSVLVVEGWKPLARWEHGLPSARRDDLAALGLHSRTITRRTTAGVAVLETVISRDEGLLALHAEVFDATPLRIDAALARLEGWLLGFPPCCVASYVAHGYAANGLAPADQAELFHWACPGCTITPRILPHLRDVTRRLRACLAATAGAGQYEVSSSRTLPRNTQ